MHLAVPHRSEISKAFSENWRPAAIAGLFALIAIVLIPTSEPVNVSNGKVTPNVVSPGDFATIDWHQTWNQLCPITVTREFVGYDEVKLTMAKMDRDPPPTLMSVDRSGVIVVPHLPPGHAVYRATIEPHCWFDTIIYQRSYKTPDIGFMVVSRPPPGPH